MPSLITLSPSYNISSERMTFLCDMSVVCSTINQNLANTSESI
jgi:hypothetical protein